MRLSRRQFLKRTTAAVGLLSVPARAAAPAEPFIQTVLGPIPASKFGFALAHEHVMCDFIGAGQTGSHRWNVDAVVRRMQPILAQLKARGVTGFVDCTPAFIGRDPRVLRDLARATGLHLLTNTGYYGGAGDKFVPEHAYRESADQLAARWVAEWHEGIEGTGIKPGFLKIGVDEIKDDAASLSEIDDKFVRAAARASKRTGLSVVCHTGGGAAGFKAAQTFISEKVAPARFVVAHSDGHGLPTNRRVAELGAWVSFDAISRQPIEEHLKLVEGMIDKYAGHLLLSHDNGWFNVGQENGGDIRDFNYMPDAFLPALRQRGVPETTIRQLTVDNPARAFSIQPA